MARGLGFLAALAIAGCVGGGASHDIPQRRALITEALPPMKVFVAPASAHPVRPNSEIARDFLDLSFQMESGRTLDVMSRFEGPITLRMIGTAPASVESDLNALLGRLKAEAGLTITRVGSDEPAAITVEFCRAGRCRSWCRRRPASSCRRSVPGRNFAAIATMPASTGPG
ncbi:MAG: DUF2927 domain-containing protein [Paracoccaceae bacterium]